MNKPTLNRNGRTDTHKQTREIRNLSTNDKVRLKIGDDDTTAPSPPTRQVNDIFGALRRYQKASPVSVEEMDEAIRSRMKNASKPSRPR